MKVAFVIDHFDPARGGAETYLAEFLREFRKGNHEIHVYAQDWREPADLGGIVFHKVTPRGLLKSRRVISFAEECEKELKDEDFDVIQSLGRTWYMDVYRPPGGVTSASLRQNLMAARGAMSKALKYLSWGLSPKRLAFFLIERRVLKYDLPKKIVAVSHMVKRDLERFYGVPENAIAVIYNGVDVEKYDPLSKDRLRAGTRRSLDLEDDDLVIMTAAHNFELKGIRFLIELAGALRGRGLEAFKVLIVGKGKDKRYRAHARALGVEDKVLFAGAARDMVPCYACADIFALLTFYDPCSNVVLEALAMGLPVITTGFNGAAELMTEGKEGHILKAPTEVDGLAEIVMSLRDAEMRDEMGRAARALAEKHSLRDHVRQVSELYSEIIAEETKSE
jgi:UDP-glucose:(heptosyl)LPS alpha-1,3-glucosyltransferase